MFRPRHFRSRRVREARRKRLVQHILLIIGLVLSVGILLSQLSYITALQIAKVDIVGNEVIQNAELFAVVAPLLEGSYAHFFSRQNIILYPKQEIQRAVRKAFPRIKTVNTHIAGFQELELRVRERTPVGVYCGADTKCYFIDDTGFMFAAAPVTSGSAFFRFSDDAGGSGSIGSTFTTLSMFRALEALREALASFDIELASLELRGRRTDEFSQHVVFTTVEGAELIFSADSSLFEEELQNLETILISDAFVEETGGDLTHVEYMDLRFGNRVFYRLERETSEN